MSLVPGRGDNSALGVGAGSRSRLRCLVNDTTEIVIDRDWDINNSVELESRDCPQEYHVFSGDISCVLLLFWFGLVLVLFLK